MSVPIDLTMAHKISQYRILGFWVWALILSVPLSVVYDRYLYQQARLFSEEVRLNFMVWR